MTNKLQIITDKNGNMWLNRNEFAGLIDERLRIRDLRRGIERNTRDDGWDHAFMFVFAIACVAVVLGLISRLGCVP
jgi:hypothetical protein